MVVPSLRDVFFSSAFSDDETQELKAAQTEFYNVYGRLRDSGSNRDALFDMECAAGRMASESQYLGFEQGFKWAVYLLTGHRDGQESVEKERV